MNASLRALARWYIGRPNNWIARMRERRYRFAATLLPLSGRSRIIDIGFGWGGALETFAPTTPVVGIVLELPEPHIRAAYPHVRFVVADGRALPFGARSFDVAFCSSVIEHVGGSADQQQLADEIRRVSTSYYVQTPNRHFPIEPHYWMPGFQYLPMRWQRAIVQRMGLGWYAKGEYEPIRLLSYPMLQELFPDATTIARERLFGLTKSFMVIRTASRSVPPL